jgi:phage shock protein PspC (stress-responsive transcriptional regulator)/signal transduction histidine kinase
MSDIRRSPLAGLPAGLARDCDDGLVAGVCAGVARWIGVDPLVVRVATVILALANGVGVVAYVVAWVVLPADVADGSVEPEPEAARERAGELALGVGCITFGMLLLVRWSAPFFPDTLVWPAAIAGLGIGLALARAGDGEHTRWRALTGRLPGNPAAALRAGWVPWLRIAAGATLLVVGLGTFLATNGALASLGVIGVSVLATVLGGALLLGPWIARLATQLGRERRERIRSEERADLAAHLHDSVLQTLALIQRHADRPQEARSLARRQERELRAWLYDDRRPAGDDGAPATLAGALDLLADEVEADHRGIEVDVVVVGDCPLDPRVEALVKAAREAVVNAVKHSGRNEVSVYAEVTGGRVEAFVRDRGKGFDPATVDGDRHGISRSIVSRMTRHGGRAAIHSAPGEGTEISLTVTRAPEASG